MMPLGTQPHQSPAPANPSRHSPSLPGRWLRRSLNAPRPPLKPSGWLPPKPATAAGTGALPDGSNAVLFLDSRVEHLSQVLEHARGRLRIVLLDRETDGLAQIAFHLRERRSIETLLIASADERGQLSLGGTSITVGNLYAFEDSLRRIGSALSPTGRICLLGRRTQSEGIDRPLLVMLSRMTGVAVEAMAMPAWTVPWSEWPVEQAGVQPHPTAG